MRQTTLPFPPWNSLSWSSLALSPLIGSRKVAILLLFLVFIVIVKLEAAETHFLVFNSIHLNFIMLVWIFRVLLILSRLFLLLSPTFGCQFASS